jgi:hypothetical protein
MIKITKYFPSAKHINKGFFTIKDAYVLFDSIEEAEMLNSLFQLLEIKRNISFLNK